MFLLPRERRPLKSYSAPPISVYTMLESRDCVPVFVGNFSCHWSPIVNASSGLCRDSLITTKGDAAGAAESRRVLHSSGVWPSSLTIKGEFSLLSLTTISSAFGQGGTGGQGGGTGGQGGTGEGAAQGYSAPKLAEVLDQGALTCRRHNRPAAEARVRAST